jgi:hypothetical protein
MKGYPALCQRQTKNKDAIDDEYLIKNRDQLKGSKKQEK